LAIYDPKANSESLHRIKEAQTEMRRVMFKDIDFSSVQAALDFGCGYGTDVISLAVAAFASKN
jgi:myxalamid-type polyketide synthase MxaE and MxaD